LSSSADSYLWLSTLLAVRGVIDEAVVALSL
jgi:hypothetical protein